MKIFGREVALWAGLANIIIYAIGAFLLPLGTDREAWLIAIVSAGLGIVVAIKTHDGLSAAILGFAKAAIVLGVGLGLHWTPEQQAILLSLIATATAMFVRTQATAPVPAGEVP
jgi:hypothetical protein